MLRLTSEKMGLTTISVGRRDMLRTYMAGVKGAEIAGGCGSSVWRATAKEARVAGGSWGKLEEAVGSCREMVVLGIKRTWPLGALVASCALKK